MEITKIKNDFNTQNIKLKEDNTELTVFLSGNGDLYMSITNGERLEKMFNDYRWIDIRQEDEDIYNVFDNLYENIIEKNVIENNIVDEDGNIIWTSDNGIKEQEDNIIIFKYDDYYRLEFVRNNMHDAYETKRKPSRRIEIRFAISGSRYKEYIGCFLNMYKELGNIEKRKLLRK